MKTIEQVAVAKFELGEGEEACQYEAKTTLSACW